MLDRAKDKKLVFVKSQNFREHLLNVYFVVRKLMFIEFVFPKDTAHYSTQLGQEISSSLVFLAWYFIPLFTFLIITHSSPRTNNNSLKQESLDPHVLGLVFKPSKTGSSLLSPDFKIP